MKPILSAIILTVCTICQLALAQEITVFGPLDVGTQKLALGPDGSVWFCSANPARVFRILDDEMEQVSFPLESFESDEEPDIAVAPDGVVYLAQNSGVPYVYMHSNFFSIGPDLTLNLLSISFDYSFTNCCLFVDPLSRLHAVLHFDGPTGGSYGFYRLTEEENMAIFHVWGTGHMTDPVIASSEKAWFGAWDTYGTSVPRQSGLYQLSLETGDELAHYTSEDGISDEYTYPKLIDSEGRLWLRSDHQYMVFDGQTFSPMPLEIEGVGSGSDPILAADMTLWFAVSDQSYNIGVARVDESGWTLFTDDDGLPSRLAVYPQLIDFDGQVLGLAYGTSYRGIFVWRISDRGWPPMRLMLYSMQTPASISIEAQVINNGPVVGVDVYIALEMNGLLLYWPNWTPEPHANQVNLRPGHNQTATIIEMPRDQVPPGSYTFWCCMTGRNTQKLIGPVDRKFESVTVVK